MRVMCSTYNHKLNRYDEGHSFTSRLTSEEKDIVLDMTKNLIKLNRVLEIIESKNLDSHTTIQQVYNARFKIRSCSRQGRTEVQHLMSLLQHDRYVTGDRCEDSVIVTNIF